MTVGHPQAARTVTVYDDMKRAAVLSVGILHLMSAYNGCRWAAFGTGLAALLVFPVVMIASAYASRIFIAARGKDCHCQPGPPHPECQNTALDCQRPYQIINWANRNRASEQMLTGLGLHGMPRGRQKRLYWLTLNSSVKVGERGTV